MSKNAAPGSYASRFAAERDRQVEAEAVDVHLLDPVAQAVGDQLERLRAGRR